jgi:hypothetical protein
MAKPSGRKDLGTQCGQEAQGGAGAFLWFRSAAQFLAISRSKSGVEELAIMSSGYQYVTVPKAIQGFLAICRSSASSTCR